MKRIPLPKVLGYHNGIFNVSINLWDIEFKMRSVSPLLFILMPFNYKLFSFSFTVMCFSRPPYWSSQSVLSSLFFVTLLLSSSLRVSLPSLSLSMSLYVSHSHLKDSTGLQYMIDR